MKTRIYFSVVAAMALAVPMVRADQVEQVNVNMTVTHAVRSGVDLRSMSEDVRQAMKEAVKDAVQSLAKKGVPKDKTISLLPLRGDPGDYLGGLLKTAVTDGGFTYVEGGSDPVWDAILKEVEWDERKEDMLDAKTLEKFGKLKATQMLMYGGVREASAHENYSFVEIELHLTSVATKQHVWGGSFSKRIYKAGQAEGLISLDPGIRKVIATSIDETLGAIKDAPKLKGVRTIALVPLAGDIDSIIGALVRDALSKTALYPKEVDAQTLAEARSLLREQPSTADAVLYGVVHDISRVPWKNKFGQKIWRISTDVQLSIQDVKSGEILWSGSATQVSEDVDKATLWELFLRYKPVVLWTGGSILVLIILSGLFRLMSRPR